MEPGSEAITKRGLGISVFEVYEQVRGGGGKGPSTRSGQGESVADVIADVITLSGAAPSLLDSHLFQTVGRYQELGRLAPHIDADVLKLVFASFRSRVEAALHEGVLAVRPGLAEFNPLHIRRHCHVRTGQEEDFGICGVGHLSWTERQREYLYAVYDYIVALAKQEVEGGGAGSRRVWLSSGLPSGEDQMICTVIREPWRDKLEAEVKRLKVKFGADAVVVDEVLQHRQGFIEALAPVVDKAPSGRDSLTYRDLMRISDHLYVLLPDLSRRIIQNFIENGVKDVPPLIPRVAPTVSTQYRAEQTDLFLLENMRRVQFESEEMYEDLKQQLSGGEEEAGGMILASCPPGCRCAR